MKKARVKEVFQVVEDRGQVVRYVAGPFDTEPEAEQVRAELTRSRPGVRFKVKPDTVTIPGGPVPPEDAREAASTPQR